MVHRRRVLRFLNQLPRTNTLGFLLGPIGYGKTSIAVQWIQQLAEPVQYVSARFYEDAPDEWFQGPDEFGVALADFINSCSIRVTEPSEDDIRTNLQRMVEISRSAPRSFVIDDLEMLNRKAIPILGPILQEALPELRIDRALLISRTIDFNTLTMLQSTGELRLALPTKLAFDEDEAAEAHMLGIFGNADLSKVQESRRESAGWITGMLTALHGQGGKTISQATLENHVLNSMLLMQTLPVMHAMVASAILPVNTEGIWGKWFHHLGLPTWLIPSTLSQLPTREEEDNTTRFSIVPAMQNSLKNLGSISTNADVLEQLLKLAIDWYVENGLHEFAARLATEQRLTKYLITTIKSACVSLAREENWLPISDMVRSLPETLLIQDPDLAYWHMHGLEESGQWGGMKQIRDQVLSIWAESRDPLSVGRLHLLNAWGTYMLSKSADTVPAAEAAHDTIPEESFQERLWAAGTASLAHSLAGNPQKAQNWSAQSDYYAAGLPQPSRWWHSNAGILRFSWLALNGKIEEAYNLASIEVESLQSTHPVLTTRYLQLMAQIDIERYDFESAETLLELAGTLADPRLANSHITHQRVAVTQLALARGDTQGAKKALASSPQSTNLRFDKHVNELLVHATIALAKKDIPAAEIYLGNARSAHTPTPRYFGDPHPDLLQAQLLSIKGETEQALDLATGALTDAENRSLRYYVVAARSTLAFIYHQSGNRHLSAKEVAAATLAAGDSGMQFIFTICGEDVRQLASAATGATSTMRTWENVPPKLSPNTQLSQREIEVLNLVAQSKSNKEIAARMFISISTVKNHLANVFDKLGTNNRRRAVELARHYKLIGN